jgi:hypothetical protein
MRPFLFLPLLLSLMALSPRLLAQIEFHPYLGLSVQDVELRTTDAAGTNFSLPTDQYLGGLEAHLGRRLLTPLFGLSYRYLSADTDALPEGGRLDYHVVSLPLGMAYRLLPADLDINLVPQLALLPTYSFLRGESGQTDYGLGWSLRAATSVYLDWATLGLQYRYRLSDDGPQDRRGILLFTLGIRL